MLVQVLVTCLGSPSLDVTLAAMRATSAFIQVCLPPWGPGCYALLLCLP